MFKAILAGLLFFLATPSWADVVCEMNSALGNRVQVAVDLFEPPTINGTPFSKSPTATVRVIAPNGTILSERIYRDLASVYDGHESGLITGPGFSFKYADDYGCIRSVAFVADTRGGDPGFIESLGAAQCTGGQTPDDICQP